MAPPTPPAAIPDTSAVTSSPAERLSPSSAEILPLEALMFCEAAGVHPLALGLERLFGARGVHR